MPSYRVGNKRLFGNYSQLTSGLLVPSGGLITSLSGGTMPNEPAGNVALTQRSFTTLTENSWSPRADGTKQTIVDLTDSGTNGPLLTLGSGTTVSGQTCLQSTYPIGQPAGSGPIQTLRQFAANGAGVDDIYLHFYIQFSTNFHSSYAGMSGTSKIIFLELDVGNQVIFGFSGLRYNAIRPRVSLQACCKGSGVIGVQDCNSTGSLGQNFGPTMARGVWHEITMRCKKNTTDPELTGIWDGILQCWVNNTSPTPDLNLSHVGYVGSNTATGKPLSAKFNQVKINNTWSGGTADGSDELLSGGAPAGTTTLLTAYGPIYLWYDELYLSGQ